MRGKDVYSSSPNEVKSVGNKQYINVYLSKLSSDSCLNIHCTTWTATSVCQSDKLSIVQIYKNINTISIISQLVAYFYKQFRCKKKKKIVREGPNNPPDYNILSDNQMQNPEDIIFCDITSTIDYYTTVNYAVSY